MRPPTEREKLLLLFCLGALFIMANLVIGRTVLRGFGDSRAKLQAFETERREQLIWLKQKDAWLPRYVWLDESMPGMTSSSKAGAQLLEEMQDQAHERELRLPRQNLLEARTTDYFHEVSVQVQVEGDLEVMIEWLATLQKPEAFAVVKELELSLDTKSKEKNPQARCNLVLARWFSPHAHPVEEEPAEEDPESEPNPEDGSSTQLTATE